MLIKRIWPLFLLTFAVLAQDSVPVADEEIVVLGSKLDHRLEEVHQSTVIVTREEIERHQWKTVADILHALPGVSLARTGGDGGTSTLFVRGAASENTLVLMDGAKMNDPSAPGKGYDFSHLSTSGIERIELLLGPQTTLYGSDASAGVVNIITRRGKAGFSGGVGLEAGDEDTLRLGANLRGGNERLFYSLSAENYDSESISAYSFNPTEDAEKDAYHHQFLTARLGYQLNDQAETGLHLSYVDDEVEIDDTYIDDINAVNDYRQTSLGWHYKRHALEGAWETGLYLNYSDIDRQIHNPEDDFHLASSNHGSLDGRYFTAEFRNKLRLAKWAALLASAQYEREEASGEQAFIFGSSVYADAFQGETDSSALTAQVDLRPRDGLLISLGGRYDDHSRFGGKSTYRISAGYEIPVIDLHLAAARGSGFKAPSIYQLFSQYGNESLAAEESTASELRLAKWFLQRHLELGVTWYHTKFEALIDFYFDPETFNSFYINVAEAETEGLSFYAHYQGQSFQVRADYEKLDAEDISDPQNAKNLLRRFDDKASLKLSMQPADGWDLFLDVLFYGESEDMDFNSFPAQRVTLDSYTLLNLGMSYQWGAQWRLNLRAENLADEDYVQVLGYNTNGRRIFAGFGYNF